MNVWDTHRWMGSSNGRSVKTDDKPHQHLFCVTCGRNFITDPVSGEQYAVYVAHCDLIGWATKLRNGGAGKIALVSAYPVMMPTTKRVRQL